MRHLLLPVLVALALVAPQPAAAQEEPPSTEAGIFTATECFTDLPEVVTSEEVRCGHVTVPLEHDEPDGETIRIAVVVREATGSSPEADPLLLLAGGPGERRSAAFPLLFGADTPFAPILENRDVVLLDQRGVGFSDPVLDCPQLPTELTNVPDDPLGAFAEGVVECREQLVSEGVTLSAFDTANNVADLDLVRQALGYEQWNVFGNSYGARLALKAAAEFEDTIRSQILSSAIPAEANFLEDAGNSFSTALQRLFDACAASESCAASFGDLEADVAAILDRLGDEPATVEVVDPSTGRTVAVPLSASDAAASLFQLFYVTPFLPYVPALIDALAAGDYDKLLLFRVQGAIPTPISQGMQLSFMCAEEVAHTTPEALQEGAADASPAAQLLVEDNPIIGLPAFDLCAAWDVEAADPMTFEPVTTDVPTLLFSGDYDQITPPRYAEEVADALPNEVLVEVPDSGHSPAFSLGECGFTIIAEYVQDPSATPDTTCATSRTLQFASELPAVAVPRGTLDACPPDAVPASGFVDVAEDNVHASAVDCMRWWDIANGVSDTEYRPDGHVTRGQMASFIARLLQSAGATMPAAVPDPPFTDVADSVHAERIAQLAELGIVQGRTDATYGPAEPVTRAQMAAFLVRTSEHLLPQPLAGGDRTFFADVDGSTHQEAIGKAADAGLAAGHPDGTYAPEDETRRDQMASFLARAADLLTEREVAAPPETDDRDDA